jgi:hypothetical protein
LERGDSNSTQPQVYGWPRVRARKLGRQNRGRKSHRGLIFGPRYPPPPRPRYSRRSDGTARRANRCDRRTDETDRDPGRRLRRRLGAEGAGKRLPPDEAVERSRGSAARTSSCSRRCCTRSLRERYRHTHIVNPVRKLTLPRALLYRHGRGSRHGAPAVPVSHGAEHHHFSRLGPPGPRARRDDKRLRHPGLGERAPTMKSLGDADPPAQPADPFARARGLRMRRTTARRC